MNNFFTLYVYELKKIFHRKIVWITIGILIAIAVSMVIVAPLSSTYSVTTGSTTVEMNGFEYLAYEKENAQMQNGQKIDDSLLEEVAEAYRGWHMVEEDGEEDGSNIASTTIAGDFTDEDMEERAIKREQYKEIYDYVYYITGDYEAIYSIDADTLYQTRNDKLQYTWTEQQLTEGEKAYWLEKESTLDEPYTYEYAGGWETILEEFLTLNIMLFLAIAVCLANTFSDEHVRKTDQLILCSRYGKKRLFFSKIMAGVTFGVGSGILFLLTAVLTTLLVYGAEGADAAVQVYLPMCSWNMTMSQTVLVMSGVYVVASILYSIIAMFLSEAMKNGVAVMGIMTASMMFTMLVGIPYRFRLLSQIYELLPTVLVSVWQLWDDRLVKMGGVCLTNFQIAPMIYVMISGLLIIWGSKVYKNYQVSGR